MAILLTAIEFIFLHVDGMVSAPVKKKLYTCQDGYGMQPYQFIPSPVLFESIFLLAMDSEIELYEDTGL
jgi:hypothetical protein